MEEGRNSSATENRQEWWRRKKKEDNKELKFVFFNLALPFFLIVGLIMVLIKVYH